MRKGEEALSLGSKRKRAINHMILRGKGNTRLSLISNRGQLLAKSVRRGVLDESVFQGE